MEEEMKVIFNNHILEDGAKRYGIALDEVSFIGAWQNFIYEYRSNGKFYILRFTPSTHRSESTIKGELDWILYLANNDLSVSTPVTSIDGRWTEVIHQNGVYFTVTSFIKAEGSKIGYPQCLDDSDLYQKLGKFTGKMHALSKRYIPQEDSIRRHDWSQNYYLQNIAKLVPSNQTFVFERLQKVMETVKHSLPKDKNAYGLIHGDIGVGNFTLSGDDRKITLFDFDEAQYSWFIEDIAIPLYYLVYVYGGEEGKRDRESQAMRFLDPFMKGYEQENSIADYWFSKIPLFLQLREIIVYTGMHRSTDVSKLDQWGLDYIAQSKERIREGIPIVDIWNDKEN